MRAHITGVLLAGALLAGAAGEAAAYPQWQFSSGASRCNQCHFSPAGGGLATRYGRDAAGEELSTWEGDGSFLHGAVELPAWLALGADLRGAFMRHENGDPEGPRNAAFPMQADAYLRAALPAGLSLSVTAGYRGQARESPGPVGEDAYQADPGSRLISREHYLMWRSAAIGPYVRAGRFFAPFGLRLAEHQVYIREQLGYDQQQETYGASAGYVGSEWEAHVTAFAPDFLRDTGSQESGAAGLFEYRLADAAALGLSGRLARTDDVNRYTGGVFGKAWAEKLKTLFMAEGDVTSVKGATGVAVNQLLGYLGATVFPARGLWLSAYGELHQTDMRISNSATTALNGQVNWFPYPHFELILLGRMQSAQGSDPVRTIMLIGHYWL